jgi:diguanylate cyclase (GGDEF)-like protein
VSLAPAHEIREREAGRGLDPTLVKHFAEILPSLSPTGEEDTARKTGRADAAAEERHEDRGRRMTANAFAEIAQANRETYTLYEIAQAMGGSISVSETMALIGSRLSTLVPFSSCALFVRGDGDTLRCRYASGLGSQLLESAIMKEGVGLSGWVMRHGRPLVNGVAVLELQAAGQAAAETDLESALVCPLSVGDEVIGTIAVYHVEAGCYTEDHRRVLEEVSRQAAVVVQNALVFEQACDNAMRDTLTGLANTRALQLHVTRELERARRVGSQFSLVLLDLDEFKGINDEHGHLAGDRALQEVANALRETTRPYDVCVRYGGDEFVVLLASNGRAEAEQQRLRLQDAVSAIRLETPTGALVPLNVSAGAAVYPDDGETYERLLARADRRMYRDKAQRKAPPTLGVVDTAPRGRPRTEVRDGGLGSGECRRLARPFRTTRVECRPATWRQRRTKSTGRSLRIRTARQADTRGRKQSRPEQSGQQRRSKCTGVARTPVRTPWPLRACTPTLPIEWTRSAPLASRISP